MFSRVRSAIVSAVGFETQSANDIISPPNGVSTNTGTSKFPYSRPHFLHLNLTEEVPLSADHRVRPIIVPRERDALPWSAGYAECVNSGKSVKNEDQATVYEFDIGKGKWDAYLLQTNDIDNKIAQIERQQQQPIHVKYFGIFDGHAGFGAALCASKQLHYIIEEKLLDVVPQIWADIGVFHKVPGKYISMDELITGALERAFLEMDQLIAEDREKYLSAGGCTAIVSLFLLGKVYVANAGDSRAIYCSRSHAKPLSFDFTPESEKSRIRRLAEQKPELLSGEYTWREYQREPKFIDLGKHILYRDAFMTGWAAKTMTKEDLRMPVITGEGKRSRVMNTIGVTRGFGDHDLKAINSKILIKPFLSAHPEINVLDLRELNLSDADVIVMATDGLWDVTSNEKAAEVIDKILTQFSDEKHKYISSAQALVAYARGKPFGECSWRTSENKPATGDDVSVFVVPLLPHKVAYRLFDECVQRNIVETVKAVSTALNGDNYANAYE